MSHCGTPEAVDRILPDLWGKNLLTGGVIVVLERDFKQTVTDPFSNPQGDKDWWFQRVPQVISPLWRHVMQLHLAVNKKVQILLSSRTEQFTFRLSSSLQPPDILLHNPILKSEFQACSYEILILPTSAIAPNWSSEPLNLMSTSDHYNWELGLQGRGRCHPSNPVHTKDLPFEFKRLQVTVCHQVSGPVSSSRCQSRQGFFTYAKWHGLCRLDYGLLHADAVVIKTWSKTDRSVVYSGEARYFCYSLILLQQQQQQ